jgi:hypothetical protein
MIRLTLLTVGLTLNLLTLNILKEERDCNTWSMMLEDKHSSETRMTRTRMKKMMLSKDKSGKLLRKNIDSGILKMTSKPKSNRL